MKNQTTSFGKPNKNFYLCNSSYCNSRYISMKFYDRGIETETLRRIEATSEQYAQMNVITGRRRIGKTTLIEYAALSLEDIGQ
ncbi:MAG: hypothetical protein K2K98_04370 [Muribaculaceae bacterium]|nr:hypothetical protein [Muribaculaceae bacterium]